MEFGGVTGGQSRETNITNNNYALEIMEQPSESIWIQELLDTHNTSNPKASNSKINKGGLVPHSHGEKLTSKMKV